LHHTDYIKVFNAFIKKWPELGAFTLEVEVDECYSTRRKYHRGRRMKTETVTILGLYERSTDLGFHLQVPPYACYWFDRWNCA